MRGITQSEFGNSWKQTYNKDLKVDNDKLGVYLYDRYYYAIDVRPIKEDYTPKFKQTSKMKENKNGSDVWINEISSWKFLSKMHAFPIESLSTRTKTRIKFDISNYSSQRRNINQQIDTLSFVDCLDIMFNDPYIVDTNGAIYYFEFVNIFNLYFQHKKSIPITRSLRRLLANCGCQIEPNNQQPLCTKITRQ